MSTPSIFSIFSAPACSSTSASSSASSSSSSTAAVKPGSASLAHELFAKAGEGQQKAMSGSVFNFNALLADSDVFFAPSAAVAEPAFSAWKQLETTDADGLALLPLPDSAEFDTLPAPAGLPTRNHQLQIARAVTKVDRATFPLKRGLAAPDTKGVLKKQASVKSAQSKEEPAAIGAVVYPEFALFDDKKKIQLLGQVRTIEEIGRGTGHDVFAIVGDELLQKDPMLTFPGHQPVAYNQIAIKTPLVSRNPKQQRQAFKEDLWRKTIREVFSLPTQYASDEQSKILVIEKIAFVISKNGWKDASQSQFEVLLKASSHDKGLLDFVKDCLRKMAQNKQHLIGDFFARNVMRREDGTHCIMDWQKPQDSLKDSIYIYLIDWSNGSESAFNYLASGLPDELKEEMVKRAAAQKLKEGQFPSGDQDTAW